MGGVGHGCHGVEHTGHARRWLRLLRAFAINDAGTAVGFSSKYVGDSDMGYAAVRWEASGTAATELGRLGADDGGTSDAKAWAINNAGTAVGYSSKYVDGDWKGSRAVRWDASGTAATELGELGTQSNGYSYAQAYAVNEAGTAVGWSYKYVGGSNKGGRAVRWDASGTVATELGNLGTDGNGTTGRPRLRRQCGGHGRGFLRRSSLVARMWATAPSSGCRMPA